MIFISKVTAGLEYLADVFHRETTFQRFPKTEVLEKLSECIFEAFFRKNPFQRPLINKIPSRGHLQRKNLLGILLVGDPPEAERGEAGKVFQ